MSTTAADAYNTTMALVKSAIEKAGNECLGYVPEIRWPYTAQPRKPSADGSIWCEVYHYIIDERQATLSTVEGVAGQRMFDSSGIVGIIVYVPFSIRDVAAWYYKFSSIIRNTFRTDNTGEVWYRNSRISDSLTAEEQFYRFSIVSEFTFSEIV